MATVNSEEFEYIEKRSEELARYSDKLREAFYTVMDIFGEKAECRGCGDVQESRRHRAFYAHTSSGSMYADTFQEMKAKIEGETDRTAEMGSEENMSNWGDPERGVIYVRQAEEPVHNFVAKIECNCGFVVSDEVELGDGRKIMKYRLALEDNEVVVQEFRALIFCEADPQERWDTKERDSTGRNVIKVFVQQKTFQDLVKKISVRLTGMTAEYREVSELAGKLVDAL